MTDSRKTSSRRSFLGRIGGAALAAGATPYLLLADDRHRVAQRLARQHMSANDKINLAVIGAGGMGMADVSTALRVPGVKLVAASDCYDGRLDAARAEHGSDLFTTRDYREILARDDVDAVICATPDHWHHRISVDALEAGKSVYCEKPMVHQIAQGADVIRAERDSGRTFQVGRRNIVNIL